MASKIIIYQVLPRLFGNSNTSTSSPPTGKFKVQSSKLKTNGSIEENGVGKLSDFSLQVLKRIKDAGFSHIWYTGLLRHATQTDYSAYGIPRSHPAIVKGKAGSPYSINDYYDIDPDLADKVEDRMEEFGKLVARTHRAGLKMIMDFVPNHVAREYCSIAKPEGVKDFGEDDDIRKAFAPNNNYYYCPDETFLPWFELQGNADCPYYERPAKATGNDHFDAHPGKDDWYETVKLNYGVDYLNGKVKAFYPVPDTWEKMLNILLFWAEKGVDGFRCDMAEMVPVEFWHYATARIKAKYPKLIFIGEVYNPLLYREYVYNGGFDYLYDKVGMYDTMRNVICHEISTSNISKAWQESDDIHDHMLYFLENHDEQRIASRQFCGDAWKAVPAMIANLLMRQNPCMIYMGQTLGECPYGGEGFSGDDGRTTIFDYWALPSIQRMLKGELTKAEQTLHDIYCKTLKIARTEKTISNGLFFDLMYVNPSLVRQYAFLRKKGKEMLLVCVNFDHQDVDVDVFIPTHAFEYLKIAEGEYEGCELLSGRSQTISLKKDACVNLAIPRHEAVVIKI